MVSRRRAASRSCTACAASARAIAGGGPRGDHGRQAEAFASTDRSFAACCFRRPSARGRPRNPRFWRLGRRRRRACLLGRARHPWWRRRARETSEPLRIARPTPPSEPPLINAGGWGRHRSAAASRPTRSRCSASSRVSDAASASSRASIGTRRSVVHRAHHQRVAERAAVAAVVGELDRRRPRSRSASTRVARRRLGVGALQEAAVASDGEVAAVAGEALEGAVDADEARAGLRHIRASTQTAAPRPRSRADRASRRRWAAPKLASVPAPRRPSGARRRRKRGSPRANSAAWRGRRRPLRIASVDDLHAARGAQHAVELVERAGPPPRAPSARAAR